MECVGARYVERESGVCSVKRERQCDISTSQYIIEYGYTEIFAENKIMGIYGKIMGNLENTRFLADFKLSEPLCGSDFLYRDNNFRFRIRKYIKDNGLLMATDK